ncbi:MAG: hypothetical protein MUO82_08955 [Candidatus Thermoplasmatota archaeon]|nr:hypothetical protein [Candidatus Thermoplasmatota archaeon]
MYKKLVGILICTLFIGTVIAIIPITFVKIAKADLNKGLVGYWSFNDGTATDSSGKNHHGIIYGNPQLVTGVVNNALYFNGIDDYIKINHHSDFNFGIRDFSFALWFKQDIQGGGTNNNYRQIICKRIPGSGHQYNLECQIQNDFLEIPIGDTTGYTTLGYNDILLNVWYHICLIRHSGNCELYINGNLVDSKSCPYYLSFTRDLYIGNDDYKYENWGGIIDEVRIYSRSLSVSEIQTLYYQGMGNQPPDKPSMPIGSKVGKTGVSYVYQTSTTDIDGDQIYYMFDWGDKTDMVWKGPFNSGYIDSESHVWSINGTYSVKVKAKDTTGAESVWSDSLEIIMPKIFGINPIIQYILKILERFSLLH